MGQTTNQIEQYIDSKREDLGSNLSELESKVKSMTDWKHHFENSPMTLLAVAFGGGIVLASMLGGRKRRVRVFSDSSVSLPRPASRFTETMPATEQLKDKALETWDNIKGALIGVAATRVKEYVEEVIPGFQEQYRRVERKA